MYVVYPHTGRLLVPNGCVYPERQTLSFFQTAKTNEPAEALEYRICFTGSAATKANAGRKVSRHRYFCCPPYAVYEIRAPPPSETHHPLSGNIITASSPVPLYSHGCPTTPIHTYILGKRRGPCIVLSLICVLICWRVSLPACGG